jgi:hypothetical protein
VTFFFTHSTVQPIESLLFPIHQSLRWQPGPSQRQLLLATCPQTQNSLDLVLFQKRSKSVSSASQKNMGYPTLGEADPGSGGSPSKTTLSHFLLFQKRSKSVSSASQKIMDYPTLGEADPGGLGACPQQSSTLSGFLLFQKRSKSISSASQKNMGYPTLGEADPGGLGGAPSKTLR